MLCPGLVIREMAMLPALATRDVGNCRQPDSGWKEAATCGRLTETGGGDLGDGPQGLVPKILPIMFPLTQC